MEVDDKYLEKAREKLLRIYSAGVSSVLPEELVKQRLKLVDGNLVLDNGEVYPLTENVYIVGFGKAVAGMAYALEQMLGEKLKKCILSLPKRTATNFETNPELEGNFYVLSALFLKIENHISCMWWFSLQWIMFTFFVFEKITLKKKMNPKSRYFAIFLINIAYDADTFI